MEGNQQDVFSLLSLELFLAYKELLQSSLRAGIRCFADVRLLCFYHLQQQNDLVSIAESIMTVLEDSGIVNTGKGSSLTEVTNFNIV